MALQISFELLEALEVEAQNEDCYTLIQWNPSSKTTLKIELNCFSERGGPFQGLICMEMYICSKVYVKVVLKQGCCILLLHQRCHCISILLSSGNEMNEH